MLRGFYEELVKLFSKTLRLFVYFVFREITNVEKHLRAKLNFKYLSTVVTRTSITLSITIYYIQY